MKYLILFVALFGALESNAQSIIEDSIWFGKTESFRTYKVWLPQEYDSTQTYQTIYCLDASLLFNPLTSSVEVYSYPEVSALPPTIVVGLFFDQRNDDMGINWQEGTINETGTEFMNLIDSSLIPQIEMNYPVSEYRTIVGHSNSSTFIQFFIWRTNPTFQGYLSMSEFSFDSDADQFYNLKIDSEKPINFTFVSGKNDAPYRYESGERHASILDSCTVENFNYDHIVLENANHLTMVPQGIPFGLESLYADFAKPLPTVDSIIGILGDQTPLDFMDQFVENKSKKYGTIANYNFESIDHLFEIYVQLKDSNNLHFATQKYADMFQDSSEYFYEAQCLEMMGAYRSAEKSYLKHICYFPSPGVWSYKRIVWLYKSKMKNIPEAIYWAERGYLDIRSNEMIKLLVKISDQNPKFKNKVRKSLKKLLKNESSSDREKNIKDALEAI